MQQKKRTMAFWHSTRSKWVLSFYVSQTALPIYSVKSLLLRYPPLQSRSLLCATLMLSEPPHSRALRAFSCLCSHGLVKAALLSMRHSCDLRAYLLSHSHKLLILMISRSLHSRFSRCAILRASALSRSQSLLILVISRPHQSRSPRYAILML